MGSEYYIVKCSIAFPGVVYIEKKSIDNEFTIEFEKIPMIFKPLELIKKPQKAVTIQKSKARPRISIKLSLGNGINDLCTREEAANLTFIATDGKDWTMSWSEMDDCFLVYPPSDFEFQEGYHVSFRSKGFYTSAKEGTTTLIVYFENFNENETEIVDVHLYKRNSVKIEYFKSNINKVVIGEKAVLFWRVLNAKKCFISGIGHVDTEGSKEVIIKKPTIFELSAEEDLGMMERAVLEVGCEKPSIILGTDKLFPHEGDPIKFYCKSSSATSSQIIPSIEQVKAKLPQKTTIEPKPNFYTAIADGYEGEKPCVVGSSLYIETTRWKNMGRIKNLDLKTDSSNTDRRVWMYQDNYYLLFNKSLYKSEDLLTWEKVSQEPNKDSSTIYSTSILNAQFIVMGGRKIEIYNFEESRWTRYASNVYESNVGVGGAALNYMKFFYGNYFSEDSAIRFSLKEESSPLKLDCFEYKCSHLDCFEMASLKGDLYLAVRETNLPIRVERLSGVDINSRFYCWNDIGSTNQKAKGWMSMISAGSMIYLLTKDWMIDLNDFKSVSPFHPLLDLEYRPWTGSRGNSPFLITKEGVLWCYEV